MRKLSAAVVAAVIALGSASSAAVATAPSGVSLTGCRDNGGQAVVPAGTPVSVWEQWSDTKRKFVRRFLRRQETEASVDGIPVANADGFWGPIAESDGQRVTFWTYNLGVFTSPGDTSTVRFDIVLTRRLREGDGTVHQPGSLFGGPLDCTITAV
jgi:hypothetical protein